MFFKKKEVFTMRPILDSIKNVPINLFAIVMSFAGLTLSWRLAGNIFKFYYIIETVFFWVTVLTFIILLFSYILKIILNRNKVLEEFNNPITSNFFGTPIISFLLLSAVFIPINEYVSHILWITGTIMISILSYILIHRWIRNTHSLHTLSPPWIISVVGTLDVAIAGVKLGNYYISFFFTSMGLVFGFVLFTLIFYRITFHDQLPYKLQPSLFILSAPFSVGLSSYLEFSQKFDLFALGLLFFSFFLILVVIGKILAIKDCCPFTLSWWAIGFPLAAFTVGALKAYAYFHNFGFEILSIVSLFSVTIILTFLIFQTLYRIYKLELLKQ